MGKALIGKVLGDDGSGLSDWMFSGLQWAVQQGARVVSISIELDFPNSVNTLAQISGPGVDILSAKLRGGLTSKSGTSMACPHVAGVTALWWETVAASALPATPATVPPEEE